MRRVENGRVGSAVLQFVKTKAGRAQRPATRACPLTAGSALLEARRLELERVKPQHPKRRIVALGCTMLSRSWLLFATLHLAAVLGSWSSNNKEVSKSRQPLSTSPDNDIDRPTIIYNDIDRPTIIYSGVGREDPNYVEYTQESLQVTRAEEDSLTCGYGFYRVENTASPPCDKFQYSEEESAKAKTWCCNCNQGQQWEGWEWTYIEDARQEACVDNIYISDKGWIVVRLLASFVLAMMLIGIVLPMLVTCGDSGVRVGCCVKGPFLFGCRDKTGCWWRTDSRALIMIAFMPFYVCEALAMMKYVSSVDLNIKPRYDHYSYMLGATLLAITMIAVIALPMVWFCLGVNGQMRGRRHIMRREKNGFTISLFHSWHLHTYYYYCALAFEVASIAIVSVWLLTVQLGDPEVRNDEGIVISKIQITPSRNDLYYLVETVFWIHIISFLHIMVGLKIYNDQFFKAKFSGVKLIRRGACFFVDYCVEEPLIKSMDCDYKKFVMDSDGRLRCAKETFAKDDAGEGSMVKGTAREPKTASPTSLGAESKLLSSSSTIRNTISANSILR